MISFPNRKILTFTGLVFSLTWLLWAPLLFLPTSLSSPTQFGLLITSAFCPLISALLLWPFGVPSQLKSLFSFRIPWRIIALSAFTIPALLALVRLFLPLHVGVHDFITSIPQCFLVMAILIPVVLGEELGWRGYLLPLFLRQYSFAASSIVLGIIWSLWHLPLFLIGYIPVLFGNLLLTFSLYTLQTTCCSIFIAWLFLAGGRRLWISCLIHASNNAFTGATPASFSDSEKLQVWSAAIAIALVGCAWILRHKKRSGEETPATDPT